jgi:hypothetical protein
MDARLTWIGAMRLAGVSGYDALVAWRARI